MIVLFNNSDLLEKYNKDYIIWIIAGLITKLEEYLNVSLSIYKLTLFQTLINTLEF